ncbi:hypothetical protein OROGR_007814 [Orobanche gracilis]
MGGGEGENLQKAKRTAAAAHDYDNDPRWANYWSNVLIPPHMASRDDVVNHFKHKFYQLYIDPELVVEPIGINCTSQPARASTTPPQSSSSSTSNSTTRQRTPGSSTRTSGASTAHPPSSNSLRWDRQTIQFSVNAWVIVVAVLAIFPLLPQNLSNRAYRLSFLGTACSSLYSLYSLYGSLELTGFTIALIPILCRALEHVAKFLRHNFSRSNLYRKYLEEACVWVESNTTTLGIMSSQAEIGNGFLLIISLFSSVLLLISLLFVLHNSVHRSQRNIMQVFMYWQVVLKLMYSAPATAGYHQSAWTKIGRTVNPLIQRYAPFLNTPISAIQRWWFR